MERSCSPGVRVADSTANLCNRTIITKLTEMNFQLRYGHECYLSRRTWALFTKRPFYLAYLAQERRNRKRQGRDYEDLSDYVVFSSGTSKDDEEAVGNGADDRCALRASVGETNEDGENDAENDGAGREADKQDGDNETQDDGEAEKLEVDEF